MELKIAAAVPDAAHAGAAHAGDCLEDGRARDSSPTRARILRVDLSGVRISSDSGGAAFGDLCERAPLEAFEPDDELLERVGAWTGSALATAVLLDARRREVAEMPIVITVGHAVGRGVPTAARVTVAGRSPMTGLYSEGQLGGELGRRLSGLADGLVLEGTASVPGAVLHVGPKGVMELVSMPVLVGLTVTAANEWIHERFGANGALVIGPAGEKGVAYASLANGENPPSFVGRGGLGAAFGALGLKALVVTAALSESSSDHQGISNTLIESPRLRMRAEGGTFELLHAFTARGDLRTRNFSKALSPKYARRFSLDAEETPHERKGCRGCPTPCGAVFHGKSGTRQGARFGTVYSLGPNLGLTRFGDALELLHACDAAGLDAKEMGATLAVLCVARERGVEEGPALWGERAALVELIRATGSGTSVGRRLAKGARSLAFELGLDSDVCSAKGQAARPEANLASVLGQCVSSRGADPIKSFPFLVGDAGDQERLEELLEPLTLPAATADPQRPDGKGRMVWWHENLALALDTTGFCAFSAAALLADGLVNLDELGDWILPPELVEQLGGLPGRALETIGATLALLQRQLGMELDGADATADRPEWARDELDQDGMLAEYRVLRGLDEDGAPSEEALELLARPALVEVGFLELEDPYVMWPLPPRKKTHKPEPGRCTVRSFGPLARAFGPEARILLQLPVRTDEFLDQLARRSPDSATMLLSDGRPLAAVYRSGRRLGATDWIADGDELDLVVAISGG